MDARLLTRCTNLALVAVVGLAAGHLLMPARAGASATAGTGFAAAVALSGALAAARERSVAVAYEGRAPGTRALWLLVGALTALGLAWLAWYVVHG